MPTETEANNPLVFQFATEAQADYFKDVYLLRAAGQVVDESYAHANQLDIPAIDRVQATVVGNKLFVFGDGAKQLMDAPLFGGSTVEGNLKTVGGVRTTATPAELLRAQVLLPEESLPEGFMHKAFREAEASQPKPAETGQPTRASATTAPHPQDNPPGIKIKLGKNPEGGFLQLRGHPALAAGSPPSAPAVATPPTGEQAAILASTHQPGAASRQAETILAHYVQEEGLPGFRNVLAAHTASWHKVVGGLDLRLASKSEEIFKASHGDYLLDGFHEERSQTTGNAQRALRQSYNAMFNPDEGHLGIASKDATIVAGIDVDGVNRQEVSQLLRLADKLSPSDRVQAYALIRDAAPSVSDAMNRMSQMENDLRLQAGQGPGFKTPLTRTIETGVHYHDEVGNDWDALGKTAGRLHQQMTGATILPPVGKTPAPATIATPQSQPALATTQPDGNASVAPAVKSEPAPIHPDTPAPRAPTPPAGDTPVAPKVTEATSKLDKFGKVAGLVGLIAPTVVEAAKGGIDAYSEGKGAGKIAGETAIGALKGVADTYVPGARDGYADVIGKKDLTWADRALNAVDHASQTATAVGGTAMVGEAISVVALPAEIPTAVGTAIAGLTNLGANVVKGILKVTGAAGKDQNDGYIYDGIAGAIHGVEKLGHLISGGEDVPQGTSPTATGTPVANRTHPKSFGK